MNMRTTLLLFLAIGASSPLMAANTRIDDLVAQTGLSKQEIRMVIGARTPSGEYRTSYNRLRKQFIAAVGQSRYQELVKAGVRDDATAKLPHIG